MIAVRDLNIAVILDPEKPLKTLTKYNFNKKSPTDADINDAISFCDGAGILSLFSDLKIKNLKEEENVFNQAGDKITELKFLLGKLEKK